MPVMQKRDAVYRLTPREIDLAVKLWASGSNTLEIAEAMQLHEAPIFNALREHRQKKRGYDDE